MSPADHEVVEMLEHPFDVHRADAALDGSILVDDPSPEYEEIVRLVQAAKAPATAAELVGEDRVVTTLAAAASGVRSVSSAPALRRRRPKVRNVLAAKVAAATAATLLGAGAAAAATGSLPASLQSSVSRGLAAVGISVPDPGTTSSQAPGPQPGAVTGQGRTTSRSAQGLAPSTLGSGLAALCVAHEAGGSTSARSVASEDLAAAAAAAHETVGQYCKGITPPATTSTQPAAGRPPAGTGTGAPSSGSPSQRGGPSTKDGPAPEGEQSTGTSAHATRTSSSGGTGGDAPDGASKAGSSAGDRAANGSPAGSSSGSGASASAAAAAPADH